MFKIKRKEQSVTSKKRFLFNNSNKLRGNTIKRTDRATIRILGSFPLLKRSPEGLGIRKLLSRLLLSPAAGFFKCPRYRNGNSFRSAEDYYLILGFVAPFR